MSLPSDVARWIRVLASEEGAGVRLLCFPHAGASAGYYRPLGRALAPELTVCALQYPARQDRLGEPGIPTVEALAEQIHDVLGRWDDPRPLAFFGHSLGAILAFEVTRLLRKECGREPVRLLLSGRRAPSSLRGPENVPGDDAAIVRTLKELAGTDPRLLDDNVLPALLPALRSDYAAVGAYRPDTGATVGCPLTVLTGDADPRVTVEHAAAWRDHSSGDFDLHVYDGDHFYLTRHVPAISDVIRHHLVNR